MNINHIISTRGIEGNHWIHDYYFDSCLLFAMDFDLRANKCVQMNSIKRQAMRVHC